MKKYLYIHGKYANIQGKRCSILVGVAIFQEGPKNPLKGTSMKSLVFACYAQFRVDAGVKDSGRAQRHDAYDPVSVET